MTTQDRFLKSPLAPLLLNCALPITWVAGHRGSLGMWDNKFYHYLPHSREVIEPLQSDPEAFGAGLSVTFSSKKASETSYHSGSLTQGRRSLWWSRVLSNIGVQSLPLRFFKEYCTGNVGSFTTQLGKMKNSPRHNHINSKAGFNAVSMTQLPFLDLATAFNGSMIHFDSPTNGIPGQLLGGFFKICDRASGQKHPFNRFPIVRGIFFSGQNSPNAQFPKGRLSDRRLQGNLSKTYFKPCYSSWTSSCSLTFSHK